MITWRQNKNVAVGEGMFGTIPGENGGLPSFYITLDGTSIYLEIYRPIGNRFTRINYWCTIGQFDSIEDAKAAAELLC